jgi:hypothetical protein
MRFSYTIQTNKKRPGVVKLTADETEFKTKSITRGKGGHLLVLVV